jgi:ABC-type uncharacterized transport system permease subunit
MSLLPYISFYTGVAAFLIAAIAAIRHLRSQDDFTLTLSGRSMIFGGAVLLLTLVLRGLNWDLVPLTTAVDAIMLLLILSVTIVAVMLRDVRLRPLQCYYAPPLAFIALLTALAAYNTFGIQPKPLNGVFLTVHVGLAFLSYALFLIASLTSVAYFVQVWRLKQHRASGMFLRMPPLELLERNLYRLILAGYPLFVITLVLGAVWAASVGEESLAPQWWFSPKIIFSLVTAVFYAVVVHGRQFGWFRGRRFAQVLFYGYSFIILSYLALGLLQLRDYNFWGGAS